MTVIANVAYDSHSRKQSDFLIVLKAWLPSKTARPQTASTTHQRRHLDSEPSFAHPKTEVVRILASRAIAEVK